MENSHAPGFGLFSPLESRGPELDVVALPDGRGLAGVHERFGDGVNPAAVVVLRVEPVAVEDLDLVATLEVDAAVPSPLAAGRGHVRDAELDVQLEVPVELLLGDDVPTAHLHRPAIDQFPWGSLLRVVPRHPGVQVLAVEQDLRPLGR